MTRTALSVADLDEYRDTPWAIAPAALPLITAHAATRLAALGELAAANGGERARNGGNGVAVISLQGVIMPGPSLLGMLLGAGGGLREFRSHLRAAVADEQVGAIVLDVDSPGGSSDQVTETAAEIRAAREAKPVVAVANSYAASAAYWLAAQADEVVATPSANVGSIGVYCVHQDLTGQAEQLGVKPTLVSAGKFKAELHPFAPLTDEAREALQARADEVYGMFVADVAKGRGVTASTVRDGFAQGRTVSAKNAVTEGLADRIEPIEQTIARVGRRPGAVRRRGTSATDLQPPLAAKTEPNDNPAPNDTQVSEEGQARIRALLAEKSI